MLFHTDLTDPIYPVDLSGFESVKLLQEGIDDDMARWSRNDVWPNKLVLRDPFVSRAYGSRYYCRRLQRQHRMVYILVG